MAGLAMAKAQMGSTKFGQDGMPNTVSQKIL